MLTNFPHFSAWVDHVGNTTNTLCATNESQQNSIWSGTLRSAAQGPSVITYSHPNLTGGQREGKKIRVSEAGEVRLCGGRVEAKSFHHLQFQNRRAGTGRRLFWLLPRLRRRRESSTGRTAAGSATPSSLWHSAVPRPRVRRRLRPCARGQRRRSSPARVQALPASRQWRLPRRPRRLPPSEWQRSRSPEACFCVNLASRPVLMSIVVWSCCNWDRCCVRWT
jgi:hypothetical protein